MLVGNKNDLHMERYVLTDDEIVQQDSSKHSPRNLRHRKSICLVMSYSSRKVNPNITGAD